MSPASYSRPGAAAARASLAAAAVRAGARVRDARERRGWTATRLAAEAGISRTLVYLVERGELTSLETYARLASALGLRLGLELTNDRERIAGAGRAEDPARRHGRATGGPLPRAGLPGPDR